MSASSLTSAAATAPASATARGQQADAANSSSSESSGSSSSSSSGSGSISVSSSLSTFRWASPSDIFRSLQKDEHVAGRLRGEVRDLFAGLLGGAAAHYEPELSLLADGGYYAATMLSHPQTTLGEEYCDIRQAVPAPMLPSPPPRRIASSSSGSTSASASAAFVAGESTSSSVSAVSSSSSPLAVSASPLYAWAQYSPFAPLSGVRRAALFTLQVGLPYLYEKAQQHSRRLLFDVPIEPEHAGGYSLVPVEAPSPWTVLLTSLKRLWNRLLSFVLRRDYTLLNYSAKLHLALFYLWGRYLEASKRTLGVRYVQLRASDVARPGYQLFGVLLMIQVCVGLGQWLRQQIDARANEAADLAELHPLPGLHAPSLVPDEASVSGLGIFGDRDEARPSHLPASSSALVDQEDEEDEEAVDCTLCLCPREDATATECGHTFCWRCISEACTNKPECPLCRQPAALNTLLLLAHYK